MAIGDRLISFYENLRLPPQLPDGVEVLNPYGDEAVKKAVRTFHQRYFSEGEERVFIFGINPGRFGAGVTGIPFTDPVVLEEACGIENPFHKRAEISSAFIYQMIEHYGGVEAFYRKFWITGVSPWGFVKDGKNLNYYDEKGLAKGLEDYFCEGISEQLKLGLASNRVICLGGGKNQKYLEQWNRQHGWFEEIIPLAHPRYILQYKRKQLNQFLDEYNQVLHSF
ncbi:MAG: DUF4918 family protein [Cyclobacteriaceae bacterium]|nr:DUF4918 family protein [Cyclobacteriaceae bacterium]MCH8517194.1 DUF4918 family protein [Cyclobacteriaceae bacterium]